MHIKAKPTYNDIYDIEGTVCSELGGWTSPLFPKLIYEAKNLHVELTTRLQRL